MSPCTRACFIHSLRVTRIVCIIYLVLVSVALIGVDRRGGSSSLLVSKNKWVIVICTSKHKKSLKSEVKEYMGRR